MRRGTKLLEGVKGALGKKDVWITFPSVLAGGFIWSIAINGILIHHQFMSGGVSGIALVIHYLFRFLPVGLMVFLLNIPIFTIGWAMISGKFFALSLMGMISFSFFLTVTTWLHIPIDNPLLAALFAGVISGVGSGIVFRVGGSGGGTGIIAMVLNRYFSLRVGMVSYALNAIPLILGALLINLEAALYSIIYVDLMNAEVSSLSPKNHRKLPRRFWRSSIEVRPFLGAREPTPTPRRTSCIVWFPCSSSLG
jgi:uncharacterized membrane-anchored protein YitT (DUF2179 family)